VTTVVQIALVVLVISNGIVDNHTLGIIRGFFIYVTAAFTVFSGLHYSVVMARRLSS
jgi:hypothetical protein